MADRRRGAASVLDISVYEEKEPSRSGETITYTSGKSERFGSYVMTVFVVAAVGALLYGVIDSKVQATAIRSEINNEQMIVDTLKSENARMKTEIESKSSMKAVESYAENVLGMQKLDKSQCEYITLESGNVIEIPENTDNFFVKVKSAISDFLDYLRG